MIPRGLITVSLLLLACEGAAPVPDKPTWVDDVKPIFQGNCFGCHGTTANPGADQFRWDIYDFQNDPKYAELGFPPTQFASPTDMMHKIEWAGYLQSPTDSGRMPPPPAIRLSDRDISVILNWANNGMAHGKHSKNHPPRIAWVQKPLFEVVDDDQDQVLGQLDCNGKKIQIDHTGGWKLPADAQLPCTARLYDGFEEGTGTLK